MNDDWDDKMSKECAEPFIRSLKAETVSKKNKEKILRASIKIPTDEDNSDNKALLDKWDMVMEVVVSRVEMRYVSENVVAQIKDMPALKNPFAKRKRGTKILLSIAKNVGEEGIDAEPVLMKTIRQICGDNNYKFRRDGVIFLKEYF